MREVSKRAVTEGNREHVLRRAMPRVASIVGGFEPCVCGQFPSRLADAAFVFVIAVRKRGHVTDTGDRYR